ncbi:hypothetical protein MARPO_0099s0009 [Marchantia polymorpha]|uniref:Uncharacterized protein n=1 Tax=Marchantia polymorpha TaxID=3197 RepID=A0A2R6WEV9_MARPO|nr:hypothetical protein MARPO_0099s0009 [Marchantia polymorpha]|eukprot:PTQ32369.1 hypothetical protein MARPO_0099s0009 [Marchantia polymorpha]
MNSLFFWRSSVDNLVQHTNSRILASTFFLAAGPGARIFISIIKLSCGHMSLLVLHQERREQRARNRVGRPNILLGLQRWGRWRSAAGSMSLYDPGNGIDDVGCNLCLHISSARKAASFVIIMRHGCYVFARV